jgi:alpha-N-arabinofuranosidase
MAAVAPLVNTRGPLFVHPDGIVKRTSFHAMAMYANLLQECVAEVRVNSDRLSHGEASVALVDAVATVDQKGNHWAIALLNRHPSQGVCCSVRMEHALLEGAHNATVLAADCADASNDRRHPDRVIPQRVKQTFRKGMTRLPPHSLTIVDGEMDEVVSNVRWPAANEENGNYETY